MAAPPPLPPITRDDFQFRDVDRAAMHIVADPTDRARFYNATLAVLDTCLSGITDLVSIVLAYLNPPYIGRPVTVDAGRSGGRATFHTLWADDAGNGLTGYATVPTRLWRNQTLTFVAGSDTLNFYWTNFNPQPKSTNDEASADSKVSTEPVAAADTPPATASGDAKSAATAAVREVAKPAAGALREIKITALPPICRFQFDNLIARSRLTSEAAYRQADVVSGSGDGSGRPRAEVNNSKTRRYSSAHRQMRPVDAYGATYAWDLDGINDVLWYGTSRIGFRSPAPPPANAAAPKPDQEESTNRLLIVEHTPSSLSTPADRERLCAFCFETLRARSVSFVPAEKLIAYSSGWTTALVVDCGHSLTRTAAVYEGAVLPYSVRSTSTYSGSAVNTHFTRLCNEYSALSFSTSAEIRYVTSLKEQYCYVARSLDALNEYHSRHESSQRYDAASVWEAAGGCVVENLYADGSGGKYNLCEKIRALAPEIYFSPTMAGSEEMNLPNLIYESIMSCNYEMRPALYANIVLSGGSSLFPGMAERIYSRLVDLAPASAVIRIVAAPDRAHAIAVGASVYSAPGGDCDAYAVHRSEYDAYGAAIINRRCVPWL